MQIRTLTALALSTLFFAPAAYAAEPPPDAKKAFFEAKRIIQREYVDANITENELWAAALEGMLHRLGKKTPAAHDNVNALLDPAHLAELTTGVSGKISGIGVVIEHVENVIIIKEPIPDGPAEKAGLIAGDRILSVDGVSVRNLKLLDVVTKIRGATGTTVDLLVQRETKEWTVPITRGVIRVESVFVDFDSLEKTAYIRFGRFTKNTVESLDAALARMKKAGSERLVIDLRGSPGGLFNVALEVADRFLPEGAPIVTLRGRDGKEDTRRATKTVGPVDKPMVILVDKKTASSGEILAAALSQNGRGLLVGASTFGKGTVEKVVSLPDAYGMKLSIARFYGPNGDSWDGKGLTPDFPIPAAKGQKERRYSLHAGVDLDADPQLRAALSVLKLR